MFRSSVPIPPAGGICRLRRWSTSFAASPVAARSLPVSSDPDRPAASTAIPMCCERCDGNRSRRCAARSNRCRWRHWGASCRPGMASGFRHRGSIVWPGEVTNDTLAPLRMLGPRTRRHSRRPLMRLGPPASAGRWSLLADLLRPPVSITEQLHATAGALLQRYGVLTREAALAESIAGGFAALYPVLRAMEEAGKIRRGYFIDGLGGLQFALPGAVDRLRAARHDEAKT